MALSAFDDRAHPPTDHELFAVLGRASRTWAALVSALASQHTPLETKWGFSGTQWGWALRLAYKKRALLYLTPCRGYFLAGTALGEKAVAAVRKSDLPPDVLRSIEAAKKYAEGRAVRLEVRRKADVDVLVRLVAIKVAH